VLPGDLAAERVGPGLRGSRIISVQGREDGYITPARLAEEDERMGSLGLQAERRWHSLGHVVEPEALTRLADELDASPSGRIA
jgi:predicted esterase